MSIFDQNSRYYGDDVSTIDNTGIKRLNRRFLPGKSQQSASQQSMSETTASNSELRLDQSAYKALNDPLLYWQIADEHHLLHPLEWFEFQQSI